MVKKKVDKSQHHERAKTSITCPYCQKEFSLVSSCTCVCPHKGKRRVGESICDDCAEEQIELLKTIPREHIKHMGNHGRVAMTDKEKRELNRVLRKENG
tara:strand:- start:1692 stop:1988 length:297 start_codon:yes stop_codon:yes gene_type:complete